MWKTEEKEKLNREEIDPGFICSCINKHLLVLYVLQALAYILGV